MAIETNENEFAPQGAAKEEVAANRETHTDFSGANLGTGGAPQGGADFLSLTSKIGISRMDSTVEPYLENILKLTKEYLPNVSMVRLTRLNNSYAFKFDGSDGFANFFGIQFVSAGDPQQPQLYPSSFKLRLMQEEIKVTFANSRVRMVDARLVIAGYAPDMDASFEMANAIVQAFQVSSIPNLKDATLKEVASAEFAVDWSLASARAAEKQLSAHGVRPRMDIGLTIKAKIRNDYGKEFRELDTDYRLLGVIGGYTEIRDREEFTINGQRVMLYRPVFNITVCASVIPLEGIAATMIAALAPTIYNTHFWARQWLNLNESEPNPGFLEEDPDNRGKPYVLKDQESLLEFVRTYMAPPVIAFQFQDGRDNIPGIFRLVSRDGAQKQHLIGRLARFFGAPEDANLSLDVTRVIEDRFDGVYGDFAGVLHDSRNIDYLHIAAKNGMGSIDQNMRRVLLGGSENPTDRARIIENVTNSFKPLYFNTVAMINPDFIRWVIQKTEAQRLVIIDPNGQNEARSLTSMLDGFGTTTNLGSIVSNGIRNSGLNLSSVWQY